MDYSIQYAKWHDDSDAHYSKQARWYQHLLKPVIADAPKDAVIMDVGCATGLLVNALVSAGFLNVRGIDTSPQQAAVAQRRGLPCSAVGYDYIYELADHQPGSFDIVFLMDVLEHVPVADQMRFVNCLFRLLKPGARLVISVPNATSTFAMRWLYNDWTHQSSFSEHSLEFVMLNQGFKDIEFLPFEFDTPARFPYFNQPSFYTRSLRKFTRALRRIEAIGELGRQGIRVPLALNLMAVCRKPS